MAGGCCGSLLTASPGAVKGRVAAGRPFASGGAAGGGAGEPALDRGGALAALLDRPHDERLAAAGVPRREDALPRGRVGRRERVAALVALDAELLEQALLGVEEPHREQDERHRPLLLRPGQRREGRTAVVARPVHPLDVPVPREGRGRDRERALAALLECV